MLFSATMPEEVMRFAHALAPTAVFVQVGSRRGPAKTITHEARILPSREKATVPREDTSASTSSRRFVLRQHQDRLRSPRPPARLDGLRAAAVHAGSVAGRSDEDAGIVSHRPRHRARRDRRRRARPRHRRRHAHRQLRSPARLDSYVHRVGRTGRNESLGHALTLADPAERRELELVEKAFGLKLIE
jgi:ATP-dependent RNA helicase RhlE